MKVAIITGVAGQDGSYLAEELIEKGLFVIGVDRRRIAQPPYPSRPLVSSILNSPSFKLIDGNIADETFLTRLIADYRPDYFYNLAAMSHVGQSFIEPISTFDIDAKAVITQLDLLKRFSPLTHYVQANTSELFGGLNCPPEGYDEDSPFAPRSPYAIAKLAAYWSVRLYREAYSLHCSNIISFNHESERRGSDFVTRKISMGVASIAKGRAKKITLGNVDTYRDWGHAKDYVNAMYLISTASDPKDYVVATGEAHSIREFLTEAFKVVDINDWESYVEFDSKFMRPSDVPFLKGNASRIRRELGWMPSINFKQLVRMMVEYDLATI